MIKSRKNIRALSLMLAVLVVQPSFAMAESYDKSSNQNASAESYFEWKERMRRQCGAKRPLLSSVFGHSSAYLTNYPVIGQLSADVEQISISTVNKEVIKKHSRYVKTEVDRRRYAIELARSEEHRTKTKPMIESTRKIFMDMFKDNERELKIELNGFKAKYMDNAVRKLTFRGEERLGECRSYWNGYFRGHKVNN